MSEKPHPPADQPSVLAKMTPQMSSAFGHEAPKMGDYGSTDLDKKLALLPGPIRHLIDHFSRLDSPENSRDRRTFVRGALFMTSLLRFIEDREELQRWFSKVSIIDDGGAVIQPPSTELDGDQSTDLLFLAPPDPEPHPDA